MITQFLLVAAGLVALYFGGELLVRAAVQIGQRLGLSSLVVGLTVVAFGTSAPELAVSLDAALVGSAEIAIANVVGSNLANIALVLALSALLVPIAIQRNVLRRDLPIMLGGFAVVALMLLDSVISRIEGSLLILGLAAYLILVIRTSRDSDVEEPDEAHDPALLVAGMLLAGVVLLAAGGHWLVEGAIFIASALGVSEAVIGMTVVAIGTSLPEIAASLISIKKGQCCMAVGNVVGSNIWTTFGVLGMTAAVLPLEQGGVSGLMLGVMALAGVALWIFCRTRFELSRMEGGVLLVGYFAAQGVLLV